MSLALVGRQRFLFGRAPFATVRPHLVKPRAQRILPCVTRIHGMNTSSAAIVSGREWMISRITFAPTEANLTEWTLVYENWYTSTGGEVQPEFDIPNTMRVYASIELSGVFYPVTFDGASFVDIPAGGIAIGKALTFAPNSTTRGWVRTVSRVNIGEFRPVGYSRMSNQSEAAQWSATDNTSLLSSGSISNTASGLYYGPSMMLAKGTSLPVAGIIGNSIDFSEDETPSLSDARANIGAWQRALDSSTGGRIAYANVATQGIRGSGMSQPGNGYRRRFLQRLAMLPDSHPFDYVVGLGNENDANTDEPTWRNNTQKWIDSTKTWFDCPIYLRTMLPKAVANANSRFTDLVNQVPTSEAAARQTLNSRILDGTVKGIKGTFDWGAEVADGSNTQKWKLRPFTANLQADFSGTSCSLDASPVLGEMLVFGAGVAGVEISTVIAVSGTGPYTVTLNTAIATTRTAGLVVKAAGNDNDGTHGTTAVYVDVANNRIIPTKNILTT